MSKISELVTFLSNRNHPLSAILSHLVLVTFRELECESIILFELTDNNEFITVDNFGIDDQGENEIATTYSLDQHLPISEAIKSGEIIVITEDQKSIEEFPLLASFPILLQGKSLFAVPISLSATPVAAFAIFCKANSNVGNVDLDFLKAVSDIFALSVYASRDFNSVARKVEHDIPHLAALDSEDLSPRQVLISRLIAEGRTNHDISELIGYSESTVRQELMKIFVLTKSTSRHEVGNHYKSHHKNT